jgi:hypothetical protein
VLGVEAVGVHDNFFELGGHSLALAEVQSGLAAFIDRTLSLVDLFRLPTVAMLAVYVAGAGERPKQGPPRSGDRRTSRRASVAASRQARLSHRQGLRDGT